MVLMSVRPARMNSSRNAVASATIASAIGMIHRHEGAEDEQQHDDRRQQAEQLGRALLDRRELGLAVVLDGHADRLDRLADGVLHRDDLLAVGVLDRLVELRLGVRDAAVLGDRVLAERIVDALRPALPSAGANSSVLRRAIGTLDRRLALRRVEPLALGRGEHDVQHAALLGGELGLDEVGRLLGIGAGDLELVAQAAADRRDQGDQGGDDADPAEDHPPRVGRAHARPARERAGRKPFVGRAPLRPDFLVRAADGPVFVPSVDLIRHAFIPLSQPSSPRNACGRRLSCVSFAGLRLADLPVRPQWGSQASRGTVGRTMPAGRRASFRARSSAQSRGRQDVPQCVETALERVLG